MSDNSVINNINEPQSAGMGRNLYPKLLELLKIIKEKGPEFVKDASTDFMKESHGNSLKELRGPVGQNTLSNIAQANLGEAIGGIQGINDPAMLDLIKSNVAIKSPTSKKALEKYIKESNPYLFDKNHLLNPDLDKYVDKMYSLHNNNTSLFDMIEANGYGTGKSGLKKYIESAAAKNPGFAGILGKGGYNTSSAYLPTISSESGELFWPGAIRVDPEYTLARDITLNDPAVHLGHAEHEMEHGYERNLKVPGYDTDKEMHDATAHKNITNQTFRDNKVLKDAGIKDSDDLFKRHNPEYAMETGHRAQDYQHMKSLLADPNNVDTFETGKLKELLQDAANGKMKKAAGGLGLGLSLNNKDDNTIPEQNQTPLRESSPNVPKPSLPDLKRADEIKMQEAKNGSMRPISEEELQQKISRGYKPEELDEDTMEALSNYNPNDKFQDPKSFAEMSQRAESAGQGSSILKDTALPKSAGIFQKIKQLLKGNK